MIGVPMVAESSSFNGGSVTMKNPVLVSLATIAILAGCASPDTSPTSPAATPSFTYELAVPGNAGDTPARVYLSRDVGHAGKPGGTPSPLLWHNGAVMDDAAVTAIFWGSSWGISSYLGDKVTGLDSFYGGIGGTSYIKTNTEYKGSNGTQFGGGISYDGHVIDASAGPGRPPKVSEVEAEVCKVITNPVANGYYPVYTDLKRGHTGYCAWHSYGTCGGVPVQFGFFFDLTGDAGCDPESPYSQSQGLAALANVSGHEISEAVTDPRNGGWWDASGAENSDKCAWTFSGSSVKIGGKDWKIQGNFSNAASLAGTGYDKKGCIDR
jgi:hypothetical protein